MGRETCSADNSNDAFLGFVLIISGRRVKYVHISPVQTYFLLIAYGAVKDPGKANSKVSLLYGIARKRSMWMP